MRAVPAPSAGLLPALLLLALLLAPAPAPALAPRPFHPAFTQQGFIFGPYYANLVRQRRNCTEERRALQRRMSDLKLSCRNSTGILEDELAVIKQEGPRSQEGKCFLGCMMQGMQIVEADGRFSPERANELVLRVYADGPARESARTAVRNCGQEVTTADACSTGELLFLCFRRHRVGLFGPKT